MAIEESNDPAPREQGEVPIKGQGKRKNTLVRAMKIAGETATAVEQFARAANKPALAATARAVSLACTVLASILAR